jgi:hypothetical protein
MWAAPRVLIVRQGTFIRGALAGCGARNSLGKDHKILPVGAIAQLVERLNGIQEVRGSTPLGSTIL